MKTDNESIKKTIINRYNRRRNKAKRSESESEATEAIEAKRSESEAIEAKRSESESEPLKKPSVLERFGNETECKNSGFAAWFDSFMNLEWWKLLGILIAVLIGLVIILAIISPIKSVAKITEKFVTIVFYPIKLIFDFVSYLLQRVIKPNSGKKKTKKRGRKKRKVSPDLEF